MAKVKTSKNIECKICNEKMGRNNLQNHKEQTGHKEYVSIKED